MSNPTVIVSERIRMDTSRERDDDERPGGERGLSVELDGGRRVHLDPAHPRSAIHAEMLDQIWRYDLPIHLEIDPVTSAILRVRVPHVTRIARIDAKPDGGLSVQLTRSHAMHALPAGRPYSKELERRLREALRTGATVLVTETQAHDIIDVRSTARESGGVILPPRTDPWPWGRLISWLLGLGNFFGAISLARAQEAFDAMAAASCDPPAPAAPCIPFRYPDNYCWARAHAMRRLMINNMGLHPGKVWNRGQSRELVAATENHPECRAIWPWHVAPTLRVRGPGFFQTQKLVIDPALFREPVSIENWKAVQGDPVSQLTETPGSNYLWEITDPDYSTTESDLARARIELLDRLAEVGPPPYLHCRHPDIPTRPEVF